LDAEDDLEKTNDLKLKEEAWPSKGAIEFRNAMMAYRPGLEPCLKGLNFKV
jgi:hypothetical protein